MFEAIVSAGLGVLVLLASAAVKYAHDTAAKLATALTMIANLQSSHGEAREELGVLSVRVGKVEKDVQYLRGRMDEKEE